MPMSILAKNAFVFTAALAVSGFCYEGYSSDKNSNCIGDGCGEEYEEQSSTEQSTGSDNAGADAEAWPDETSEQEADTLAQDSAKADTLARNEGVKQDTTVIYDDEDSNPEFVESADDYRARKEGFSKTIQFGIRLGAGANLNYLGKHTDDWKPGFDAEGGAIVKLPLGRDFGVAAGLEFSYRYYSYESSNDYSKNKANLTTMLFNIPIYATYSFDEDGFFVGLGADIELKMHGETEFKQTIDTSEKHETDKRNNTMPSTGVECGGLLTIGYNINKNVVVDVRAVQNFTNFLDLDVIAEHTLVKTKLYTTHVTLGITLQL